MKPNTFLIGAPKCGTTALAHYLGAHPNVFFSDPKEPLYWSQSNFPRAAHEPSYDSLADYERLFDDADPSQHHIVAEGSTRYLFAPDAVSQITAYDPDARFLVMVRDPVSAAAAYHMEMLYSQHETVEDFATAWNMSEQRAAGVDVPRSCPAPELLDYRAIVRFGAQVKRLYAEVDPSRVHVATLDDLREDPARLYGELLTFLGLDDDGRTDFPILNAAHGHRFPAVARLLLAPPAPLERTMLLARNAAARSGAVGRTIKSVLNRPQTRDGVDSVTRSAIESSIVDDIGELGELLDRDLSHWTGSAR